MFGSSESGVTEKLALKGPRYAQEAGIKIGNYIPGNHIPWNFMRRKLTIPPMVKALLSDKGKPPELVVFGSAVRRHRKALGHSQEAFGDRCGIDRSYMGGIERGEHNLALVNILKIVAALEMRPSEFFRDLDGLAIYTADQDR